MQIKIWGPLSILEHVHIEVCKVSAVHIVFSAMDDDAMSAEALQKQLQSRLLPNQDNLYYFRKWERPKFAQV